MTCAVLRCPHAARHLLRPLEPGSTIQTASVCDDHKQQVDAGEPWYLDSADDAVYLGPDLLARGLHRVTGVSGALSPDGLSDVDGMLKVLTVHYVTLGGDGAPEQIEFVMTPETKAQLIAAAEWA